ncbi:MAG: hypothetical protein H6712_23145 [Myxococcales bacterium]|nr:hypothetical protein [Myxococcales bacterium]MCB9716773.1 hypothetical protein [Myxococcales bacterium]
MLPLALATLLSLEPPTVTWDLTVELATEDGSAPDRVCLVTPVHPDRLDSPWFTGVPLDELIRRGVLIRDLADGPITFDRESALRSSWFDGQLAPEREPVRQAFAAMRIAPIDDGSCLGREPEGCEPAWELTPPPLEPSWPWAVMCSPSAATGPDATVVFLSVRAVDLDRAFTPYVLDLDAFGEGVRIRFDSVRTSRQLQSAHFQASVGVVGGDVHRRPAVPSFDGRVRLPLEPRCRTQRLRLHQDPEQRAQTRRSAVLLGSRGPERPCAPETSESADACSIEPGELHRGIFELKVPMSGEPRQRQLELRVEPRDGSDPRASTCASASWSDGKEPDVVDLEPTRIRLRWRWPCFAQTSPELRCPGARVRGGGRCEVDERIGADACSYSCDATSDGSQSVGWPVSVELHHEALGMDWSYELETLDTEVVGSFAAEERRLLAIRGPRHPERSAGAPPIERWPAWWTERRGDGIEAASVRHEGQWTRIAPVGTDDPVVGAVTLPGTKCREQLEVRYVADRSTTRRYSPRSAELEWPFLELPAPDRGAFPLMAGLGVGAAVGSVLGGRDLPQLHLAGDVAYRSFARRDRDRRRPAWLLGLRYFAILGRKEYTPLSPPSWSPAGAETVRVWRHGPALRVEVRFDQREQARSYFGFGAAAGVGWTNAADRDAAAGRIPVQRRIPYAYVAPELTLHYRILRASAFMGVLGPDPTFELLPNPAGNPTRTTARSYSEAAWILMPGLMVGVEL